MEMADSGDNNSKNDVKTQNRLSRSFILSCAFFLASGLIFMALGMVSSIALYLSQFSLLAKIPSSLMYIGVATGLGVIGRYALEYSLVGLVHFLDGVKKYKLNQKLKIPKENYFVQTNNLQKRMSEEKTHLLLQDCTEQQRDSIKKLCSSLETLEKQTPDAEFNAQGQYTNQQPILNRKQLFEWEKEKFNAMACARVSVPSFLQEVENAIKDPNKSQIHRDLKPN
ncbi:MAG: hypothetical protein JSS07_02165 [Proteobacteria bacterium]|nr:hypothetical protein [Pseudomonadota bacterium]